MLSRCVGLQRLCELCSIWRQWEHSGNFSSLFSQLKEFHFALFYGWKQDYFAIIIFLHASNALVMINQLPGKIYCVQTLKTCRDYMWSDAQNALLSSRYCGFCWSQSSGRITNCVTQSFFRPIQWEDVLFRSSYAESEIRAESQRNYMREEEEEGDEEEERTWKYFESALNVKHTNNTQHEWCTLFDVFFTSTSSEWCVYLCVEASSEHLHRRFTCICQPTSHCTHNRERAKANVKDQKNWSFFLNALESRL